VIPPEDPVALAKVLQNCIDHRDEVDAAKEAAKKAASDVWAWEKYEPMLVAEVVRGIEGK
jgi:hypothetical protein